VVLVTSRLTLREAEQNDAAALAAYQADPRYLEHYPAPPDAERIIQLACEWAAELPRLNYQLIVTLGTHGPAIGCVGLRQAGYAHEALSTLIGFAQHQLGIHQLWASTTLGNQRAHRLLRNLGFSPEPPVGAALRFGLRLAAA
jgi:RimJ/RimL family protein N-acetyltransferase